MQNEIVSPATSYVGTPMYMAPELIRGVPQYDGKVDALCLQYGEILLASSTCLLLEHLPLKDAALLYSEL